MEGLKLSLPEYELNPTPRYLVKENNPSWTLQGIVDVSMRGDNFPVEI